MFVSIKNNEGMSEPIIKTVSIKISLIAYQLNETSSKASKVGWIESHISDDHKFIDILV